MSERVRIVNNTGTVEVLAHLDLVKDLLAQGFKKTQIHRRLVREGGFSMSYTTFCYHLRRLALFRSRPAKAPRSGAAASKSPGNARPPSSGPRIITSTFNKCPDPRDMNPEDAL